MITIFIRPLVKVGRKDEAGPVTAHTICAAVHYVFNVMRRTPQQCNPSSGSRPGNPAPLVFVGQRIEGEGCGIGVCYAFGLAGQDA